MGPSGGFALGVGIFGLDVTATTNRPFNITMYQDYYSPIFKPINSTEIPLVGCTKEHINFNDDLAAKYDSLNFSQYLCPQLNSSLHLQGKTTSNLFSRISIIVDRCNSTTDATCMNDTMFAAIEAQLKQFAVVIPIINTLVNAGN